jgi:glutamate carboxypeptidase
MDLYAKYLRPLSSKKEQMADTLMRWVNINSGTGNLLGLSSMLTELKEAFSPLEPAMEEVELKPYACINDRGEPCEQPLGKALVLRKRESAPIQVFLGGHMDTVYPANSPFQTASRVDRDILKGPGAADMKGGLVILLNSLETLEMSPFAENIGWRVVINPDEEIGSPGSAPLIAATAKNCRLGLIFEPALPNGALVNARKGSINLSVIAKGKSAHAGRDFHLGRNAISALSHFILQVEALTDIDQGITVNVGKITGGESLNIVPDLAVCGLNVRMVHGKDLPILKEKIRSILEELNRKIGFSLSLHIHTERPPKPFDKNHQALFAALNTCAPITTQPSGGVTDGNILYAAGVPSIDSLGALGGEIHTHNEFILLDSLVSKSELVSLFLMKLSQGELLRGDYGGK